MRNPGGYARITGPSGKLAQEADTITCFHCQRVVFVKRQPGGFCRTCMSHICGPCVGRGSCTPWLKQIEASEQAAYRRRQWDLALAIW